MEMVPQPIAQFGSSRLFPNHVVQSTPGLYKSLSLADVQFCRFRQTRSNGLAFLSAFLPAGALAMYILVPDDGPLWTVAVCCGLALAGVACVVAWRRMVTGIMTIRGRTGFLVEFVASHRSTPAAARDFIDALMRQRAAICCAPPVDAAIAFVVPEIPARGPATTPTAPAETTRPIERSV